MPIAAFLLNRRLISRQAIYEEQAYVCGGNVACLSRRNVPGPAGAPPEKPFGAELAVGQGR